MAAIPAVLPGRRQPRQPSEQRQRRRLPGRVHAANQRRDARLSGSRGSATTASTTARCTSSRSTPSSRSRTRPGAPSSSSWLESDLAATTQPWKIALFHRSPYSAGGEHGSDLPVRVGVRAGARTARRPAGALRARARLRAHETASRLRDRHAGHLRRDGRRRRPLYPAGTAEWTASSASQHHYVRASVTDVHPGTRGDRPDRRGLRHDDDRTAADARPRPTSSCMRRSASAHEWRGWTVEADATAAGGQRIRHPGRGRRQDDHGTRAAGALFRARRSRRRPARPIAVGTRQGRQQLLGQRLGVRAVRRQRDRQRRAGVPDRNDQCHGREPRRMQWLRPVRLGMAGQRVGRAACSVRRSVSQTSGPQRLRIQSREDGLSIDQIVLSPERYLTNVARRDEERHDDPHSALRAIAGSTRVARRPGR